MANPDYATALDRMLQLTVLLGKDMEQSLARDGLTPSRVHVLWIVAGEGPQPQRHISEALRVSARNITGLVDALVADGFVTREPHPSDRRAALITLTGQGERVVAKMTAEQAELTDRLFADWGRGEFDGFNRGLERVVGRLAELIEESAR